MLFSCYRKNALPLAPPTITEIPSIVQALPDRVNFAAKARFFRALPELGFDYDDIDQLTS